MRRNARTRLQCPEALNDTSQHEADNQHHTAAGFQCPVCDLKHMLHRAADADEQHAHAACLEKRIFHALCEQIFEQQPQKTAHDDCGCVDDGSESRHNSAPSAFSRAPSYRAFLQKSRYKTVRPAFFAGRAAAICGWVMCCRGGLRGRRWRGSFVHSSHAPSCRRLPRQ